MWASLGAIGFFVLIFALMGAKAFKAFKSKKNGVMTQLVEKKPDNWHPPREKDWRPPFGRTGKKQAFKSNGC